MVACQPMDTTIELEGSIEFNPLQNEFTGSARESLKAPGPDEPICLISYELTHILLGDGPHARSGFWRSYRRELKLNLETNYDNYHVKVCRHELTSLRMKLNQPVYFREGRLTTERQLDPFTVHALTAGRFGEPETENFK